MQEGQSKQSEGSDELLRRARYSAILIQGQVHRQRQSETKKIIQKSQRKGANIRSGEWTCRACSQKVDVGARESATQRLGRND